MHCHHRRPAPPAHRRQPGQKEKQIPAEHRPRLLFRHRRVILPHQRRPPPERPHGRPTTPSRARSMFPCPGPFRPCAPHLPGLIREPWSAGRAGNAQPGGGFHETNRGNRPRGARPTNFCCTTVGNPTGCWYNHAKRPPAGGAGPATKRVRGTIPAAARSTVGTVTTARRRPSCSSRSAASKTWRTFQLGCAWPATLGT